AVKGFNTVAGYTVTPERASPDWSRSMFVAETDAEHHASKFRGGTGASFLVVGGLGRVAAAAGAGAPGAPTGSGGGAAAARARPGRRSRRQPRASRLAWALAPSAGLSRCRWGIKRAGLEMVRATPPQHRLFGEQRRSPAGRVARRSPRSECSRKWLGR